MSANEAMSWLVPIAAGIAVVFGIGIVGLSLRHMIAAITTTVCVALVIGLVFLSAPKWTEITLEVSGVKATLAQLEQEKEKLTAQNVVLNSQIAVMRTLASLRPGTAEELVHTVGQTRQNVEWATFLPSAVASYGVVLNAQTINQDDAEVKEKLGEYGQEWLARLNSEGYQVIAPASEFDLSKVPARDVVITPFPTSEGEK